MRARRNYSVGYKYIYIYIFFFFFFFFFFPLENLGSERLVFTSVRCLLVLNKPAFFFKDPFIRSL